MAKKLFIGYDLGDGETITDMAILDDSQIKSGNRVSFAGMTMPDNNTPGQAIPTVFGLDRETGSVVFSSSIVSDPEAVEQIRSNFKRRPSDLIAPVDETRRAALIRTLQEGFPDRDTAPELYTEPLLTFADAVKSSRTRSSRTAITTRSSPARRSAARKSCSPSGIPPAGTSWTPPSTGRS